MSIVRVTAKGQVVIPAKVRHKYHISKGSRVEIKEAHGEIVIRPLMADPINEAWGMFKSGESALDTLVEDRQEEADR